MKTFLRNSFPYFKKYLPVHLIASLLGFSRMFIMLVSPQIVALLVDRVINPLLGAESGETASIFTFLIEEIPSDDYQTIFWTLAAARAACAEEFILRLPEGYNTFISEGSALSGGERQLLSFARLILADPKVIILDEATSHVDTQTERSVQESLKTLLKGRTSFVIAHRLSTIRGADKIVFIKDGEMLECGTHAELLAKNGYYTRLVQSALK